MPYNYWYIDSERESHRHTQKKNPLFLFISMAGVTVDEFLNRCQESGDAAYGALRSVLERLEDPNTRSKARIFLSDLYKRVGSSDTCLQKYHFHIQDIVLDQYEGMHVSSLQIRFDLMIVDSMIWIRLVDFPRKLGLNVESAIVSSTSWQTRRWIGF